MNIPLHLRGSLAAVMGAADWERYFDLTRKGLRNSFIAPLLLLPTFYLCAVAIQKSRALVLGGDISAVPLAPFILLTGLFVLTFPLCAYVMTMIFECQDRFRPWVIVRHWAFLALALIASLGFIAVLIGLLPLNFALVLALFAYLFSLFVDFRLIQEILGFGWEKAVLLACLIAAIGMVLLMTGLSQVP